ELIAYSLLPGLPGLTFDPASHAVSWHFDREADLYVDTLGTAIAALHAIPRAEAVAAGMADNSVADIRAKLRADLERVRETFKIPPAKWDDWQAWLAEDSYWPPASVVVHGDLYAGHVMVEPD